MTDVGEGLLEASTLSIYDTVHLAFTKVICGGQSDDSEEAFFFPERAVNELLENTLLQLKRHEDFTAWLKVVRQRLERLHAEKKQWLVETEAENEILTASLRDERRKVHELHTVTRWLDKEKLAFQKVAEECQDRMQALKRDLETAESEVRMLRGDTEDLFSALKAVAGERDAALRRCDSAAGGGGGAGGVSSRAGSRGPPRRPGRAASSDAVAAAAAAAAKSRAPERSRSKPPAAVGTERPTRTPLRARLRSAKK